MASDSVDECEVADCALIIPSRGADVLGPAIAKTNTKVDLPKSAIFPETSASASSSKRHLSNGSPTALSKLECVVPGVCRI